MTLYPIRRFAYIAVSAVVLTGCTVAEDMRHGFRPLAAENGLMVFDAPAFDGTEPVRVMYADHRQREEYVRFQGGGAQAEVVYLSIRKWHNPRTVLNGVAGLDGMHESWNFLKGRPHEEQEAVAWETDLTKIWYKTFGLSGSKRTCMGFRAEWDENYWDRESRPTRALFGYYCAKPGTEISTVEAGMLMDGLGIRGVSQRQTGRPTDVTAIPETPTQQELAALARGGDGGVGAVRFPMLLAWTFSPDGGGVIIVP